MKTLTNPSLFLLTIILLCSIACRKHKLDTNGLPPATQEGKNTLGFLLNGKPWTPKGFNGTANLSMNYDSGYKNGVWDIAAYRIITDTNREYFGIGIADSLNYMTIPVTLPLGKHSLFGVYYSSTNDCTYNYFDSTIYRSGSITITKLDKSNGVIISGTFNAILYKPGCDTIKITEGRFDMSLH